MKTKEVMDAKAAKLRDEIVDNVSRTWRFSTLNDAKGFLGYDAVLNRVNIFEALVGITKIMERGLAHDGHSANQLCFKCHVENILCRASEVRE